MEVREALEGPLLEALLKGEIDLAVAGGMRRIRDYPALAAYLHRLHAMPGIAETTNFDHIKQHYYRSHGTINPTGIVPAGPALDLYAPHGREVLGPAV